MVEIEHSTVPTAMDIDEVTLDDQDACAVTVALKNLSAAVIAPPWVKSNLADGEPLSLKSGALDGNHRAGEETARCGSCGRVRRCAYLDEEYPLLRVRDARRDDGSDMVRSREAR